MSFQILPNSLGSLGAGSSISQLTGPLGSLFYPSTINNLVYPSDLASNPAMCHAVQFSIYDYTTGFEEAVDEGVNLLQGLTSKAINNISAGNILNGLNDIVGNFEIATNILKDTPLTDVFDYTTTQVAGAVQAIAPSAVKAFQAPTYKPKRKTDPLANISLYMPDSLQANHNASYSEVSFTDAVGLAGLYANAYSDIKGKSLSDIANQFPQTGLGKTIIADIVGKIGGKIGGNTSDLTSIAKNALGVYTNPQIQLIYKGINLREFSLNFIFTPKSPQEAQTTKNIIDTFTFYSVPGLGSASIDGQAGQYLTPPQLFTIKFVFLGQNGIGGSISNIFSSALSNLGLGSLITSDPTNTITNGQNAKVMTIQECVLENVSVDYAPNGWASFNDGYPVQTTLSLQFKETQIFTKDKVGNAAVSGNYNAQANFLGSSDVANEVAKLGGSAADFNTGSNGFGNYGE